MSQRPSSEPPDDGGLEVFGLTDTTLDDDPDARRQARKRRRNRRGLIVQLVLMALVAVLVVGFTRTFVGQLYGVSSSAMAPALARGELAFAANNPQVRRGQVVLFEAPSGWAVPAARRGGLGMVAERLGLLPSSEAVLIGRVVGTPGDHVICCDAQQRLRVNGVVLDETYAHGQSGPDYELVVPPRSLYVLADKRDSVIDSRCHLHTDPFVPVASVRARVLFVVRPFRADPSLDPTQVFAHVPEPGPAARSGVLSLGGAAC